MTAWFDSWGDRINPITVRELRRVQNRRVLEGFVLLCWLSAVIIYAVVLIYYPEVPQDLSRQEWELLFSAIPALGLAYVVLVFIPWIAIPYSQIQDELLDIIPLSPQQQVHGYWAISWIISFFLCTLFCPFIAFGQIVGPAPYVFFLVPFALFFVAQIGTLVCLSFVARLKRQWELMVGFGIIYFGQIPIGAPWAGIVILWIEVFHWQELSWDRGFGFVSLFVLLPAALLPVGYVAYRLSIYGFKTWLQPFWRAVLLNIAVYSLLSFLLALLYLGIAAAVNMF
jgi:hypothetical protein